MGASDNVNKSRRMFFLKSGATTALVAAAPLAGCAIAPAEKSAENKAARRLVFLSPEEAKTMEAVVDTFVPKDEVGPGAVELGVVDFIDRRLGSGYGVGTNLYMSGPFGVGVGEQGTQSALTPRETWRIGLAELQEHCLKHRGNRRFEALSPAERNTVLLEVREGKATFASIPARDWLAQAFNDTMEGYFCDPIHGGNAGMGAWKMVGFPGPFRIYTQDIEKYRDRKFVDAPRGIADLT